VTANRLLETLRAGRVAAGLVNTYPAAGIVEGMCAGWDFVWIDAQHGQIAYESALHAVQAARGVGVESVLRPPGHEPGTLGRYADLAPAAVMVPMVEDRGQAEAVVRALRFPPRGERSYGGRRAVDLHGRSFHVETELMVIVQIETLEGVENAAEIARTEGIDGLFFGPDDMKCSMGLAIDTPVIEDAQLLDAMKRTSGAASDAGKFCGSVAANAETVRACLEAGCRLLVAGGDNSLLRWGAAAARQMLRAAEKAFDTTAVSS
jgi:4-hydroxy-2-oxoheptanedioate aldolase